MIDRFLGDALGVLSIPFWSNVLQCGARMPIQTFKYWTVKPEVPVLKMCVTLCDIVHRGSVAVLFMLYKIRCKPMRALYGTVPGPYVPVRLHEVLWYHIGILIRLLAEEPGSTTGPLFLSQCPRGTILLTLYSMVWNWRVSRTGPMFFCWLKLLYPYFSLLICFPFSSFCR